MAGLGQAGSPPVSLGEPELWRLEECAVGYFLRLQNPANGLIADSSRPGAPCSIAATGLGLAAYIEMGKISAQGGRRAHRRGRSVVRPEARRFDRIDL